MTSLSPVALPHANLQPKRFAQETLASLQCVLAQLKLVSPEDCCNNQGQLHLSLQEFHVSQLRSIWR